MPHALRAPLSGFYPSLGSSLRLIAALEPLARRIGLDVPAPAPFLDRHAQLPFQMK